MSHLSVADRRRFDRRDKPLRPTSIYAISKMDQELMCLAVGTPTAFQSWLFAISIRMGPAKLSRILIPGAAAIFSSRLLNRNVRSSSRTVFKAGTSSTSEISRARTCLRSRPLALTAKR